MKRFVNFVSFIAFMFVILPYCHSAFVPQDNEETANAGFEIARFLIAGSVEDKEPIGVVDVFASSTEKVYCFLEARNIKEDTEVSFVWYHNNDLKAKVTLPVRKGLRWRTFSSKKLGGGKGQWKVELQDATGEVLKAINFSVE